MLLDINNIETFLAVVDTASITKAARRLGKSQPGVSNRIKLIEQTIGTPLVIRKRNRLTPTTEGAQLYKIMERHQKALYAAEREMKRLKEKKLSFVIGASSMIYDFILPQYMFEIKKNVDEHLYFKNEQCKNIIEELHNNTIDIAIVETETSADGLLCHEWIKDEIVLFSRNPLPTWIDPEALYAFSLVYPAERSFIRQKLNECFKRFGIEQALLDIVGVVNDISMVKGAILHYDNSAESKQLASWIPKIAIAEELAMQRLYASRLRADPIEQQFYIVYKQERSSDPVIGKMLNYLQSVKHSYAAA